MYAELIQLFFAVRHRFKRSSHLILTQKGLHCKTNSMTHALTGRKQKL